MKKATLLIVLIFAIAKLYGQGYYEIDFVGSGADPDNIRVENLTQGTSLDMDGTDVLHLMLGESSIGSITADRENLTIFPIPVRQTCNIEFMNANRGNVSIRIYGITGKQIHDYSNVLSDGSHRFSVTGLAAGTYVIRVQTETDLFTGKVTSVEHTESSPAITHKAGIKSSNTIKNAENPDPLHPDLSGKNTGKAIVEMDYNEGDQLKFTGYSNGFFNGCIFALPGSNNTYTFQFIEQLGQCNGLTQITDTRDGRVYNTIGIGDQCWMAESLKYLPEVVGPGTGSNTTAYYYVYGYDGTNVTAAKATANFGTYGVLYNWPAAMNGMEGSSANPSGVQGICPSGWHLPSDAEWQELEMALGMSQADADLLGWRGTNEGSKLAGNASLWEDGGLEQNPEFGSSGFAALPAGYRSDNGSFGCGGSLGWWWTATDFYYILAWSRELTYLQSGIYRFYPNMEVGIPVRCVRD